jgi:hypothetical protein
VPPKFTQIRIFGVNIYAIWQPCSSPGEIRSHDLQATELADLVFVGQSEHEDAVVVGAGQELGAADHGEI